MQYRLDCQNQIANTFTGPKKKKKKRKKKKEKKEKEKRRKNRFAWP
jgi:hypothetical protein